MVSHEGPEDANFPVLLILEMPLTHPHALQKLPRDMSNMSLAKSMNFHELIFDEK